VVVDGEWSSADAWQWLMDGVRRDRVLSVTAAAAAAAAACSVHCMMLVACTGLRSALRAPSTAPLRSSSFLASLLLTL